MSDTQYIFKRFKDFTPLSHLYGREVTDESAAATYDLAAKNAPAGYNFDHMVTLANKLYVVFKKKATE